jgi:hypothetical protein
VYLTDTDLETILRDQLDTISGYAPDEGPSLATVVGRPDGPRRRRRFSTRHRTGASVAVVLVLGGGLSIAATSGVPVLPGPVVRALGWESTPGGYNADTTTTRQLLSIPGPDGAPLNLWYSDANDHGYCVSLTSAVMADPTATAGISVAPGEGSPPEPGTAANGCDGPVGDQPWQQFGGAAYASANSASLTFIVHVPGASSVRLRFADGGTRTLPIGDHWTAGWLTRQQALGNPVLIGYSANGTEVARFDRADFFSPWRG